MNNFRLLIILSAILSFVVYVQSQRIASRKEKQMHPLQSPASNEQSRQASSSQSPIPTKPEPTQPVPTREADNTFVYPNAEEQSANGNTLYVKSSDDPDRITDWYKEQIAGLGMKTKTFVKTTSNGNIFNKLVGVNESSSVTVEITKNAEEAAVSITIVR